jgi:predicted permease
MNDLRFALRQLLKHPGFTAAATICLALGIGATTGIFSVVNAVLLRPLPYVEPDRLVRLYTEFPGFPNGGLTRFPFSQPEYLDLKREVRSWQAIEGWTKSGVNLAGEHEPTRATACFVTGGLLPMLGVPPLIGRTITPADDQPGAPMTVNLSHALWQRAFGGARQILGREILLNGTKCIVLGVMPPEFRFPPGESDPAELWVPTQIDPAQPGERSSHGFNVIGRLQAGVSPQQARAELEGWVKEAHATTAPGQHRFDPEEHPIASYVLQDEVVRGLKPALTMLLGAVCFVLLIACVNVANLLLARAEARQREMAIRGALGASFGRLIRQFVTEGLVIAVLGATLGLVLAHGGLHLVKSVSEASLPRAAEIAIDGRVFFFALGICVVTGLAFGLTPLWHVARQDLQTALKSTTAASTGAAGTQGFRHALVVSELALALILLAGTGLMLRAFWNLQQVEAGFDGGGVVTAQISLPRATYPDRPVRMDFWQRLLEKSGSIPGMQSVAVVSDLPPQKSTSYSDTTIEGFEPREGGPLGNVDFYQAVSQDYFKTLNIRLLEGRFFDRRDGPGTPDVVVINQTMARMFWGNQSPLGRRLRPNAGTNLWCTVIGVAEDTKNHGLEKPTGTEVYLLLGQNYAARERTMFLTARSTQRPGTVIAGLQRAVRELDRGLPLARVRSMDEVKAAAQSRPRFLTLLLTLFAGVALVLAAVGIYGVIAYSVAQRTKEFGVRLALGAQRGHVFRMVLGQGLRLTLIGLGLGLVGAWALTRFLSSLLFGVSPTDPVTFAGVSLVLTAVAFLACYLPARRATRVNPMVALRYE